MDSRGRKADRERPEEAVRTRYLEEKSPGKGKAAGGEFFDESR